MTDVARTASTTELDDLHARLSAAAEAVDLSPIDAPELTAISFKGGDGSAVASLPATELPSAARALRCGRYTFLLTPLPSEPTIEAVNDWVRRFRNQCVVARSYLSSAGALDLQGILLGPRASEPNDDWKALALMIERDDRVARKFAWLRPASPDGDNVSFADLLKRTVLARPWISGATFTMAALDNLQRVAADAHTAVPRTIVDQWVNLALTERNDPDALVEKLIEAWARRGQG